MRPRSRLLTRLRLAARPLALLLVVLPLAACGTAAPAAPGGAPSSGGAAPASSSAPAPGAKGPFAQLYAQARGQTVVFASPVPLQFFKPVLALFNQTFPGVKVDYQAQGNENIAANLPTQEAAGNVQVDVSAATSDFVPTLLSSMAKVNWPAGTTPDPFVPGGVALHWFDSPWVLAYNTQRVPASAVPHTWQDLLQSRWSGGRMVLNAQPTWADALLLSPQWGQQKALAFGKQLAAQKPLLAARPILGLQDIVSGQADIGITLAYLVIKARAQGQPVDVAPLSPQAADPDFLFVLKGAPHPAAGTLLAAWLASAPARQAFDKASDFGLAAPCNASKQAAYLCSKGVSPVFFKTYADRSAAVSFEKAFAADLGEKA